MTSKKGAKSNTNTPRTTAVRPGRPHLTPFRAAYRKTLYQKILHHGINNRAKILKDEVFAPWSSKGTEGEQKLNYEFDKMVKVIKKMDPDSPGKKLNVVKTVKIVTDHSALAKARKRKQGGQSNIERGLAQELVVSKQITQSNIDKALAQVGNDVTLGEGVIAETSSQDHADGRKRKRARNKLQVEGKPHHKVHDRGEDDAAVDELFDAGGEQKRRAAKHTQQDEEIDNVHSGDSSRASSDDVTDDESSNHTSSTKTMKVITDWNAFKQDQYQIKSSGHETAWRDELWHELDASSHGMEGDLMAMMSYAPDPQSTPPETSAAQLEPEASRNNAKSSSSSAVPTLPTASLLEQTNGYIQSGPWKAVKMVIEISSDEDKSSDSEVDELESDAREENTQSSVDRQNQDMPHLEQQSSQSSEPSLGDRLQMDLQRARAIQRIRGPAGGDSDSEVVEELLGSDRRYDSHVQAKRAAMERFLTCLVPGEAEL